MTSRGYRAAQSRPIADRADCDGLRCDEIGRLHAETYGVYGVREIYLALETPRLAGGQGASRHVTEKPPNC